VKIAPLGYEVLVTDISVNPSELASLRERHPGVPNGDVVPCLTDLAMFSARYSRVNDIAELIVATDEVKPFYKEYGVIRSYPLQVIPKVGTSFIASTSVPQSIAQPWAVCRAEGELKWHAFGFENLTMRVVNSNAVLKLKTLEVMALKNLSQKEKDDLISTENRELQQAKETGTLDAIANFVVRYSFSDIANLVLSAEKQRQQMIYAANAPYLEKQAKQAQDRARQIAEATNAFLNSIAVGVESNCGPVLEIKGDLTRVYHPVANFGNEHWIRKELLLPTSFGCRFENGTYQGK
jgi:hypothetical protein